MNNRIKSLGLIGFYIFACFIVGCIPEDSLEWSDDGSVGLLRVDEALYLVDGQTGELTSIAQEDVQPWPDISSDGGLIAYSREVECDNLSEGLKLLPPGQVKMIKYNAKRMGEALLDSGHLGMIEKFPEPEDEVLRPEDYKNWAIRYMYENADDELLKILGDEGVKLAREKVLRYFQVVVVSRYNLDDKCIAATNIFGTVATQLSPDKQYVAYIMQTQYGQDKDEYSLYVTSLNGYNMQMLEMSHRMLTQQGRERELYPLHFKSIDGDNKAMLIDKRVAIGYDWREDSRAIAYLNADTENLGEDELALGTLQERIIADEENNLLTEPINLEEEENGSVETYKCTSDVSSLAGLIYYPWLKVRYGLEGRIFFSTCSMPLPMSKRDEPGWSLFCYDSLTGVVTNVLPSSVSIYTSQAMPMCQFSLSPDGKKVLLPIKNNRLIDYEFGTDKVGLPIFEDEGFGDEEVSALVPTFKGNNEISFLVSGNSHYFSGPEREKTDRYEIVVLNRDELKGRILSENWPDEIMENFENED